MIDLQALKEQLKLLGHNLPDEQVVAILKEMNIDYDETTVQQTNTGASATAAATEGEPAYEKQRPGQQTGSILDSFQGRQTANFEAADTHAPPQGIYYGYTGHADIPATDIPYQHTAAGHTRQQQSPQCADNTGSDVDSADDGAHYYANNKDDAYLDDEPGISYGCRVPAGTSRNPAAQTTSESMGGARQAWVEPVTRAGTFGSGNHDLRSQDPNLRQLGNSLGKMSINPASKGVRKTLQEEYLGGGSKAVTTAKASAGGAPRPSSAIHPRPSSASGARDQLCKGPGARSGPQYNQERLAHDDDSDGSLSDEDIPRHGASLHSLARGPSYHAGPSTVGPMVGDLAAEGRVASTGMDPKGPYSSGWRLLGGQYPESDLDAYPPDAGVSGRRYLNTQASDASFVSRASSTRSRGASKASGRKVDRVQRYQQLQQEWSQNRFLKQASGASRGTSRKPINFHSHFASLHAAEEAERQRVLRETRAKTKKELGAATEAPTANRRDELRWQTRMRLKTQT